MTDAEEARPLAWSRVALGILFLLRTTPALTPLRLPYTAGTFPLLGWPSEAWHGAAVWGLNVPASVVASACLVRTLAAFCFTLGYRTLLAGAVAALSGYLLLFQEPFGFNATLHLLLQGTLLLAVTDAGATLALRPTPARNPASGKLLIRVFLASIYLWAGLAKLRGDWLDGRTLALFHENGSLFGALADFLLGTEGRRVVAAWSVVATELSLPVLLFLPRTRRWAPYLALSLHFTIELVARPDLLGWAMAGLLLSTLPRQAQ
jgi:uncharacterized membrane protein YphA (DoxX/SURF4 family)